MLHQGNTLSTKTGALLCFVVIRFIFIFKDHLIIPGAIIRNISWCRYQRHNHEQDGLIDHTIPISIYYVNTTTQNTICQNILRDILLWDAFVTASFGNQSMNQAHKLPVLSCFYLRRFGIKWLTVRVVKRKARCTYGSAQRHIINHHRQK